jgi:hypothetical protein
MVVVVVVSLTGDRENRGHGTKDKGWLSVEFGLQRRATSTGVPVSQRCTYRGGVVEQA